MERITKYPIISSSLLSSQPRDDEGNTVREESACPLCEIFAEELRHGGIEKKDLFMLLVHFDNDRTYHQHRQRRANDDITDLDGPRS